MQELAARLAEIIGPEYVLAGETAGEDYAHDEALSTAPQVPALVVRPGTTEDVAAIARIAGERGVPVTARGSGTGLSGAAIPHSNGILVSFERMNAVLEIDQDNHMAVVQPGITLAELDAVLAPLGLVYPVNPGESSASLGGNISTNAGGMRAVKYGVTRHQVLGVEAVLASGEVIRSGGKLVKSSTGYDLTQLLIGSEGTLALITEATLKLYPRPAHQSTVLVPFRTLDEIMRAVPRVVASGVGPLILEYIDMFTMAAITAHVGLDLGIPETVKQAALAYLVVVVEGQHANRVEEDVQAVAELLTDLGAIDVYVLPSQAAVQMIEAREKAFWAAKAAGIDDIVDVVVPRASIAEFMARIPDISQRYDTVMIGCGHAGDGNVHLSVFQKDKEQRYKVMHELFEMGMSLGGAISGEHGLGRTKKRHFLELVDPVKIELMRSIKKVFDPNGILNPGAIFDE